MGRYIIFYFDYWWSSAAAGVRNSTTIFSSACILPILSSSSLYTREYIIIIAVHHTHRVADAFPPLWWRWSCDGYHGNGMNRSTAATAAYILYYLVFARNATQTLFAPLIGADAMNSFNKVVDDETRSDIEFKLLRIKYN